MNLKRIGKIPSRKQRYHRIFWQLAGIFWVLGVLPKIALAGFSFSGGATYPTLMGNAYQNLTSSIGGQAEAWLDQSWLPSFLQFNASGFYENFTLKSQGGIGIRMMGGFFGMQAHPGNWGTDICPFLSLGGGAVYEWMTYNGYSSITTNSATVFAAQAVPGVDIPIMESFGVVLEAPIRTIFVSSPIVILDASLSVRVKL